MERDFVKSIKNISCSINKTFDHECDARIFVRSHLLNSISVLNCKRTNGIMIYNMANKENREFISQETVNGRTQLHIIMGGVQ